MKIRYIQEEEIYSSTLGLVYIPCGGGPTPCGGSSSGLVVTGNTVSGDSYCFTDDGDLTKASWKEKAHYWKRAYFNLLDESN